MKINIRFFLVSVLGIALLGFTGSMLAAYKAHTWAPNSRESYPASLASEGVTIAVEPLFNDALAARVFDKDDIVTRGIMPLAIVIFNDNDYPVEVDALSIELIRGDDHYRTLLPKEAVNHIYRKDKAVLGQPLPKVTNEKALEDFNDKFLLDREIAPHGKGGGFVFMKMYDTKELASYLSSATVYIPNVYRLDNGSRLIFFEINLDAAVRGGMRR
jgi:hypothetical protein